MQVVEDRHQTEAVFGEVIVSRGAVDEGVCGITRALERDGALGLVDEEFAELTLDTMDPPQGLDDLQLGHGRIRSLDPLALEMALAVANGTMSGGEPFGVVEGQSGDREEQQNGEAHH